MLSKLRLATQAPTSNASGMKIDSDLFLKPGTRTNVGRASLPARLRVNGRPRTA